MSSQLRIKFLVAVFAIVAVCLVVLTALPLAASPAVQNAPNQLTLTPPTLLTNTPTVPPILPTETPTVPPILPTETPTVPPILPTETPTAPPILPTETPTVQATAQVCGVVEAMSSNTITIDGQVLDLAANADVGSGVGTCVAVCATVDTTTGEVVSVQVNASANVEGTVTAYEPGVSITVGGQIIPIAPDATISGDVEVGSEVEVAINGLGQARCIMGTSPSTGTATPTATAVPTGTPSTGTATPTATVVPTSTPAPDTTGAVAGQVTDADTGAAISGADVVVRDDGGNVVAVTTTDSGGEYEVGDLPPGMYTVTASASGYSSETITVEVQPGQTAPGDIQLQPEATPTPQPGMGNITGTVTDASTGSGISGATIEVYDSNGDPVATTVTGPGGRYTVRDLPPGDYTVVASAPGYEPRTATGSVQPDETTTINLALTPETGSGGGSGPGALEGGVIDDVSGQPVPDATVVVYDSAGNRVENISSDSDGRFDVSALESGQYVILVTTPGYEPRSVRVIVVADQTTRVTVRLTPVTGQPTVVPPPGGPTPTPEPGRGHLCGVVQTSSTSGEAVTTASVRIFDSTGRFEGEFQVDSQGRFCAYNLPPGEYRAVATGGAACPASRLVEATVLAGQTTNIAIRLTCRLEYVIYLPLITRQSPLNR